MCQRVPLSKFNRGRGREFEECETMRQTHCMVVFHNCAVLGAIFVRCPKNYWPDFSYNSDGPFFVCFSPLSSA